MRYAQALNSGLSGLMQSIYAGKTGKASGQDDAYKQMMAESQIGSNEASAGKAMAESQRLADQREYALGDVMRQKFAEQINSQDPVQRSIALQGMTYLTPNVEQYASAQDKVWDRGDLERATTNPDFRLSLNGAQAAQKGSLFDSVGDTGYVLNQGTGGQNVGNQDLVSMFRGKVNSEIGRNNRPPASSGGGQDAGGKTYFPTTISGDDFLRTLSPADQAHVLAINDGREPYPTSKLILQPYYQRMLEAVAKYNPDFDATKFNTRKNASTAFTTGTQGKQLLAFGSAIGHLGTLDSLVGAMANNDIPALNKAANFYSKQTGSPAVTNFESAKGIVAKEVMKSIVAGGGGVEERMELDRLIADAKSPQQLRGVIATYTELMKVQHDNLITQYKAAGLDPTRLPVYGAGHEAKSNPQFPATQDAAAQQRRKANKPKAVQWLKGRNIQTQDQFRAAVQSLRDGGWSAAEIQQIQQEAGL